MKVKQMKKRIQYMSVSLMLLVSTIFIGLVGTVGAIPPGIPGRPSGPTEGSHHVELEFRVSPVFAQSSHDISYNFIWGDSTNTWIGPFASGTGPVVATHEWTLVGMYQIQVQARDETTSETSELSEPLEITIVNLETPAMPEGPTKPEIGQLCEYSIPAIQAPSGHEVLYLFDWATISQPVG